MWSENPVCLQLPVIEPRFTSKELDELLSFFQSAGNAANVDEPSEPLSSSPSSSDNPSNPIAEEMDEKRKKRKISNRESARRSRWRKKKYVENLKADLKRLKAKNREYNDRLAVVLNRLHLVKTQNELIRFESVNLIQRHTVLNRVLQANRRYRDNLFVSNLNPGRFVNGNGLFT